MRILVKFVTIIDHQRADLNEKKWDIHIVDGKINTIAAQIEATDEDTVIEKETYTFPWVGSIVVYLLESLAMKKDKP